MASVVAYRNASPRSKVHVLQESSRDNSVLHANAAATNKNDKREIIILRKKPKLLPDTIRPRPQTISVSSIINSQNSVLVPNFPLSNSKAKKASKSKETPAKNINPPPIAVARRNARERNRVKQVNNGFALLRQHIPDEIAELYENANTNRSSSKKLSKVETLRMAVEYIRSLECLLDENRDSRDSGVNLSLVAFPSPASSESFQNSSSFEQSYVIHSPMDEDDESNPSTALPPVGHSRYVRIPGTDTFQLIAAPPLHVYEDEENIHPLTPNSDLISQQDILVHQNLISSGINFLQNGAQELALIHSDMISTEFYSDTSLSPHQESDFVNVKYVSVPSDQSSHYVDDVATSTVPINTHSPSRLSNIVATINPQIKDELLLVTDSDVGSKMGYAGLKQEPGDMEDSFPHNTDEVANMNDVISWWQVGDKMSPRL